MKKILPFFLMFFSIALFINAQTVIHYESFETDGDGSRYTVTGGFTDGIGDYFIRTNGVDVNNPSGLPSYTLSDDDFFFAGEDTKCSDNPNSDVSFVIISGIDITGATNITIAGLFASGAKEKFDPKDYLHIYANIDAAGEILIGAFEADISSGFNTTFFGVDNDFDGIADGQDSLNTVFAEYSFALGSTGNSLDLRIEAYLTAGDEEIAFDSITVSGTVSTDTDPPVWTNDYPYIYSMLNTKGQIAVSMDEPGKVYYILVNDGATAPDAGQVIAGNDYSAVSVLVHDSIDVTAANTEYLRWIEGVGIVPETPYDIYLIAQDDEPTPNIQVAPVLLECTTTAAKSLSWVKPEVNDTLELGDTLTFQWTSANISEVMIAIYSYSEDAYFYITGDPEVGEPIPASDSIYKMKIPLDGDSGKYNFLIHDAADSLFQAIVGPAYFVDSWSLAFTNPQSNDTVYVGDTLTFEWDAVKVDSILIGAYDYADGEDFMLTVDEHENPAPVAADIGHYKLWIPYEANTDSVKFYLYDAEDTESGFDSLLIYLIDTIPPMIEETVPANGSTGFPPAGQFTLYITENVTLGTGYIYLFKADGTPVDTFDVTEIYFDQNLFSFTPELPLEPETEYYFKIDAGIVTDWKDTGFEAVTGSDTWSFTVTSSDLYFSEYVEGSSNNKALEIYNPTNATVDLSKYGIATSTNGSNWHDPDPLTGMLDPGDVYVIINPGFDFSLIDSAAVVDTIWGVFATNHNGNDGRALAKLIEGSWDENHTSSFIDVIGYNDEDPFDGWDVAGVTAATKDHTLMRKATISIGNTDFTESAGTNAEDSEWRVFDQNFVTNLGYATPDASYETEILEFVLLDTLGNNVTVDTTINNQTYTIDVKVIYSMGSVLDSMVPEITLSEGATSDPATGDTVDFTLPATFTVTAEDELTTQDWTITVTLAAAESTETDILAFEVDDQIGNAVIDTATHTVTTEVEYLTGLTALTPEIEISSRATIVPLSGVAQDFTDPVVYTVIAEDGTTTQEWTITITEKVIPDMSIYNIQYTTETSGDSPHINEQVRVSGIVTAININQDDFIGYFLQDSSSTWNGLYVYDPGRDSTQLNDSLTVVAIVAEYNNVTQVSYVVEYIVNSTGNTLPDPLIITTGETDLEPYEGVLVTVENAECINNDMGYDEVELNDGSGAIIVDDYIYNYTGTDAFTVSNIYRVTGVMYYSSGDYKIIPRNAGDIEDVTVVNDPFAGVNIHLYPNPSNGLFKLVINNVKNESLGIEIMNLQGQILYRNVINDPTGFSEIIDLTKFGKGLYFLRINDGNKTMVEKILIQ